ncbi:MAG: DNA-methyltransferase, partial [Eubacteriales bacterium]
SYEHLFLLSKSAKYYYDDKAIAEPISPITLERYKRGVSNSNKYADDSSRQMLFRGRDNSLGMNTETRNKRDVWSIATNTYRMEKHFAMFPEKLVIPCILAGSKDGGIVLDPFMGSGTTGAVATKLGRNYLGIDLNSEYCEAARNRIAEVCA